MSAGWYLPGRAGGCFYLFLPAPGPYVTLLSQPVLRRAGARSHDFVVAIGFAHPVCTSPRDPNSIPRPRNAESSPFWQLGQLPLVPAKLDVCRPRASPARRCAVVQIPVASRGQPRVAGRSRIAQARAASYCTGFSLPPAPVNGRLPGVNAALAFVLPNLACRCNFGLQLRCQLTRVIATTPTRTRARSQSRAPPRGVKPTCAPSKPLSSWRLEPPSMVRNGRLRLISISSSRPQLVTSSPTPL